MTTTLQRDLPAAPPTPAVASMPVPAAAPAPESPEPATPIAPAPGPEPALPMGGSTLYSARPVVSWSAVASLVLGLIGLFGAPPTMGTLALASGMAVALGHAARAQDDGPHRLATTGLVLGYLVVLPTLMVWVSVLVVAMIGAMFA